MAENIHGEVFKILYFAKNREYSNGLNIRLFFNIQFFAIYRNENITKYALNSEQARKMNRNNSSIVAFSRRCRVKRNSHLR